MIKRVLQRTPEIISSFYFAVFLLRRCSSLSHRPILINKAIPDIVANVRRAHHSRIDDFLFIIRFGCDRVADCGKCRGNSLKECANKYSYKNDKRINETRCTVVRTLARTQTPIASSVREWRSDFYTISNLLNEQTNKLTIKYFHLTPWSFNYFPLFYCCYCDSVPLIKRFSKFLYGSV